MPSQITREIFLFKLMATYPVVLHLAKWVQASDTYHKDADIQGRYTEYRVIIDESPILNYLNKINFTVNVLRHYCKVIK